MDAITTISPYEYIGNSLGKINQNFLNLQKLPVTLSAKYIQIDDFITSLRSQVVTNNLQVSGAASVKDTFRAEGTSIFGSNTNRGEYILIQAYPVYISRAISKQSALIFGHRNSGDVGTPTNAMVTNLYKDGQLNDTLRTDGNFYVTNNAAIEGNFFLSGNAVIGLNSTKTVTVESGNTTFKNTLDANNAIIIGTTTPVKLYRNAANRLTIEGSLYTTINLTVDGNTTLGTDSGDSVTVNGIIPGSNIENTVVVLSTNNVLVTDEIDPKVWGTALVDGSGTGDTIPKWSGSGTVDTLTDSNISDTGSVVTLAGRVSFAAAGSNPAAVGQATLGTPYPNGATEITVTGVTTNSRVFVTRATPQGTLGHLSARCTTNTVIISSLSDPTTRANDTSTINYFVVN